MKFLNTNQFQITKVIEASRAKTEYQIRIFTHSENLFSRVLMCAEMERRYKLMASLGVRNIGGFNRKVTDAEKAGNPLKDPFWEIDRLACLRSLLSQSH